MSIPRKLDPVIHIDESKCTNCYACITACPVKYCMNGAGKTLTINSNMCIGCGNCINVCSQHARLPVDDTERFMNDLGRKEKMVLVIAPAVASVFAGNYLKLNGYFKSLGIEGLFDVSFGAELTVISYINFIKEKKPRMVIAQPCPAIVSYIQIYQPELISYLAPADSPMLHTVKMIKEYYPQYKDHKIAIISPCIAKKREFAETGMGDYNVTMIGLKNYFEKKKIDISTYPPVEYVGPSAERAVNFSSPGGLLDTAERFIPGIRRNTRKIEGIPNIYHYLEGLNSDLHKPAIEFPLLVDCLNCEHGCNGGTGTGNNKKTQDELESPIRKRSKELEKKLNPKRQEGLYKKYHSLLDKYWKPGLYNRRYVDLSGNLDVKRPNDTQLKEVYRKMKKTGEHDLYDCTSCGYQSCRRMATAIFNNLNKPDNCIRYTLMLLDDEKKTTIYINQQLQSHINRSLEVIERINGLLAKLDDSMTLQARSVDNSSTVTGQMVDSLKTTSDMSRQKRESIVALIDNAARGQEAMQETIKAVQDISELVDGIASAIRIISVIASNTNLLAMNAAIEAAHAGDAGRGFAVVADEIRHLSETTRENSRSISQTLSNIISGINTTSKRTGDTGSLINDMSEEINGFAGTMTDLIDTLGKLSAESSGITRSLKDLQENSTVVKSDYTEMLSLTDRLRYDINFLAAMSADIVRAIEENDEEILTRLLSVDVTKKASESR